MTIQYATISALVLSLIAWGCGKGKPMQSRTAQSVNFDSLTVPAANQPEGTEYARGRAILSESREAYAALQSYHGTIKVYATGKFPGRSFDEQRIIKIDFASPGNLSLEGQDSNNDPFAIKIQPKAATVEWQNKIHRYANGKQALHAFSGITLYGSLVLPGALLNVAWGNEDYILPLDRSFLDAWGTKARLNGKSTIDGSECHRVVCERDTITWTVYLDSATKLIRRADCEITESHMEQLKLRGAGGGYTGNLMGIMRSQLFSIDKVTWVDRRKENNRSANNNK